MMQIMKTFWNNMLYFILETLLLRGGRGAGVP